MKGYTGRVKNRILRIRGLGRLQRCSTLGTRTCLSARARGLSANLEGPGQRGQGQRKKRHPHPLTSARSLYWRTPISNTAPCRRTQEKGSAKDWAFFNKNPHCLCGLGLRARGDRLTTSCNVTYE